MKTFTFTQNHTACGVTWSQKRHSFIFIHTTFTAQQCTIITSTCNLMISVEKNLLKYDKVSCFGSSSAWLLHWDFFTTSKYSWNPQNVLKISFHVCMCTQLMHTHKTIYLYNIFNILFFYLFMMIPLFIGTCIETYYDLIFICFPLHNVIMSLLWFLLHYVYIIV